MSMIVTLLEKYLAHARNDAFTSIAISVTGQAGIEGHFAGDVSAQEQQLKAVLDQARRLQEKIDNWQPWATNWALDEGYACYHCGLAPNGFDFLTWLVVNDMLRAEAGVKGPLKVAFWRGHEPMDIPWLDTVYRPMLSFIGAVEDNRAMQRIGIEIYLTKFLVNMYRLGMKLPLLKAKGNYDLPCGSVTITLRECDYWTHRNSDLSMWTQFAKSLGDHERVVFVRDTAKANESLDDFETCPLASIDIDARLWLYQHSKLNLFVSNGPVMLCVLSDTPYLSFIPPETNDSGYVPNNPLFWKIKMGVDVGSQFPWSNSHQRIVWEKASFENVKKAYEEHFLV